MQDEMTTSWLTPKRRIILLVSVVVLVVVIVLLTVFFIERGRALRRIAEEEQAEQESQVERASERCEDLQNPEKCQASVRQNLAEESGNVDYCTGLVDSAYDACVNLAALTAEETELCELIQNKETRDSCVVAVLALTPSSERTFEFCEQFESTQREDCVFQLALQQSVAGNCDSEAVSKEMCTLGAVIAEAQSERDPDVCEQLSDSINQAICIELTYPGDRDGDGLFEDQEEEIGTSDTSADSDSDGLSDAEELSYGSDPADADSDDDGYTDGTEVQSGYNPIGPGPLND